MAEMLGNKNHSNDQGISQWTSKYRKQDVFCVRTWHDNLLWGFWWDPHSTEQYAWCCWSILKPW
jgi:hypothetical protein